MVVKKKLIDRQTCDVEEAGSFERFLEKVETFVEETEDE